jgi:hypothetical protein
MYNIEFDRVSNTLNLRLTGFWTRETMDRFAEEFGALTTSLIQAKRSFVVLSDCREYPVQSADIGEVWSRLLGPVPITTAPYAVVVGSVLNKLQAERALKAPNVSVFTEMRSALEWVARCRNTNATK